MNTLSQNEQQACRAFDRLFCIRTVGMDEMHSADRHFDGGEYSDEAWGKLWEDMASQTIKEVADRFDLWPHHLSDCIEHRDNEEQRYFWMAQDDRPLHPIPYGDTAGTLVDPPAPSAHKPICHEYWERGLDCQCIPEGVKQAIRDGANPEEVM